MWIIRFGKWMRTVACTWYFLSHTLLLVRNTFPFRALRTKIRLFTLPPPLLTLLKQLCWHLRELANAFVQWQMWCIQRSFHMKKKTGAFKHRQYNSRALVMISNISKKGEGKKISFTCFGVKEREQLYYPKSALELSVLLGAHFLSTCRQICLQWQLIGLWLGFCMQYGSYCFII